MNMEGHLILGHEQAVDMGCGMYLEINPNKKSHDQGIIEI